MFTGIMPEFHLLELGRCWLDWNAKVTTHYVKDGRFFFEAVTVDEGAWLQAHTRVMVPERFEGNSRVLPGSMVLPRESISSGQVWGDIPAAPVATVLAPNVRVRSQADIIALEDEAFRRVSSRRGLSQRALSQRLNLA